MEQKCQLSTGLKAEAQAVATKEAPELQRIVRRFLSDLFKNERFADELDSTIAVDFEVTYDPDAEVVRLRPSIMLGSMDVECEDRAHIHEDANGFLAGHNKTIGNVIYVKDLDEVWLKSEAEKYYAALGHALGRE